MNVINRSDNHQSPLSRVDKISTMGRKHSRKGRPVNGVLLLDKPTGITSNQALQKVKRLYRARKAGHTGSLDKEASGMLPLCFGEATKFSAYLLDSDKHYHAVFRLGIQTSTGDAAGETVAVSEVPELNETLIERSLDALRGDIEQVPPMHSALKHKGERLYKLAYQGIEVDREPRPVTIHALEYLGHKAGEIEVRIHCSKGTYIRTLAEDFGVRLGCKAHLKSLRRTGVGPFRESQMVSLATLVQQSEEYPDRLDQCLLAVDTVLTNVPGIELSENMAHYMCQGQAVMVPRSPTQGLVRIYDQEQLFLGVGEVLEDGRVAPRRLVQRK